MKDTELWIISGKLVDGNKVLKLELISNRRKETTIKYETFKNFYKTHTVINAKPSENHITGLGINLNYLPTYKNTKNGIVQVKGMSKQQVIQLALPLLNKYNEKINEDHWHNNPNNSKIMELYLLLCKIKNNYIGQTNISIKNNIIEFKCYTKLVGYQYVNIFYDNDITKYKITCNEIVILFENTHDAADVVMSLSYMIPKKWNSCFKTTTLDFNTKQGLVEFSGIKYVRINKAIYVNQEQLNFDLYTWYNTIYNFLNNCFLTSDITLYRGISFKVETGEKLYFKSFSSTSILLPVTLSFASDEGTILRIKKTSGLHAFMLNLVSGFRNTEFEVLINSGYTVTIGKCIGSVRNARIFDCEIEYTPEIVEEFTVNNYNNTVFDKIYNRIISSNIMDKCIIQSPHNKIILDTISSSDKFTKFEIECNDNKTIELKCYKGIRKSDSKTLKVTEKQIDTLINYIINYINSNIDIASDMVYFDIVRNAINIFSQNGFIVYNELVTGDRINNTYNTIKDDTFKFTVIGDSDDKVVLTFKIYTKDNKVALRVKAKTDGNAIDKTIASDNIDEIPLLLYKEVIKNCKLDCTVRCDKVINTIARYTRSNVQKYKNNVQHSTYKLSNIDKNIESYIDSDTHDMIFKVNESYVRSNFFDTIQSISTNVYSLVKGD